MRTLATCALTLSIALSGSARAQSFTYADFSSVAGINLVGLSTQVGTILRLQDNLAPTNGGDNRAAAWYATPVCVAYGFDTTFTYRMHTPSTTGGSDGMAFVIQNDPTANPVPMILGSPDGAGNLSIGRHAAAIGYGVFATSGPGESVDNSVAIELDTFLGTTQGDPDANHISIHTNGTGDNSSWESFSIGRAPTATVITNLNDGAVHAVRVVYTPGAPGTLDVYLDGLLKITTPYSFATGGTWLAGGTVGGLNLIGGTSAYVGFTSSAGSAREYREVQSWTWTSTCNTPFTTLCAGDGSDTPCPCTNPGLLGRGCDNTVASGGAALASTGLASISADSLVLNSTFAVPFGPGLYYEGSTTANPTAPFGIVFGNGLRCAGGATNRLEIRFADVNGAASTTAALGVLGAAVASTTYYYQQWYRDTGNVGTCTPGAGFNFSNAISLTWGL